ncbi:MAG TPA: Hpt domain-containing protein [Gemmatimonadales bacterium]|nr:Hpt domain-containing protein [Gemmatimonadales bacterium]
MTDAVDDAFRALRIEYLASLPERLEEVRADIDGLRLGRPEAASALKVRLHRLAGSGGSYGFVQLSSLAREAERWLIANAGARETDELELILKRLTEAAAEAQRKI